MKIYIFTKDKNTYCYFFKGRKKNKNFELKTFHNLLLNSSKNDNNLLLYKMDKEIFKVMKCSKKKK